jgi:hypothetical protein
LGYDKYRHDFAKLIWQIASPKWDFDDATFDRSAASFDNPDHVSIVIHNYRALARDNSLIENDRYNSLPNLWRTRNAERDRRIPRVFMLR